MVAVSQRLVGNTEEAKVLVPKQQLWERAEEHHPFPGIPKPKFRILRAKHQHPFSELNSLTGVCSSSLCPSLVSFSFLFLSLVTETVPLLTKLNLGLLHILPEYDPVSPSERDACALISLRVSQAVELLEKGRELQAQGDFSAALGYFSQVVESYKDFAFLDYARVGRALALYEVGDREEAIAEMEDVSISLKGYPEVHAALAAALYADKHAPLLAENQFTIATLLDPHFTDLSYVRDTKHWPPSLISSLQHFITLS